MLYVFMEPSKGLFTHKKVHILKCKLMSKMSTRRPRYRLYLQAHACFNNDIGFRKISQFDF